MSALIAATYVAQTIGVIALIVGCCWWLTIVTREPGERR